MSGSSPVSQGWKVKIKYQGMATKEIVVFSSEVGEEKAVEVVFGKFARAFMEAVKGECEIETEAISEPIIVMSI